MEIKLPIYEKREVVKTYTAETYDITFGTMEDLVNVLDMDKLTSGKDEELVKGVCLALPKVFGMIKPLLKDIFDGITDDEIKKCKLSDVAKVIVKVIKVSMSQIVVDAKEKN